LLHWDLIPVDTDACRRLRRKEEGGSLPWILTIFGSSRIGLLLAVIDSSAKQKQELREVKSETKMMNITWRSREQ